MGEERAERIIRSRIDGSYKDKAKVIITKQEIKKKMTKEELEKETNLNPDYFLGGW